MYQSLIVSPDKALLHLFFHCCFKDGTFDEAELETLSDIIVSAGLKRELDLTEEIASYREYSPLIKDEMDYLHYLVRLIKPVNRIALFSFCVELCLSDKRLAYAEEIFISKIANLLHINEVESNAIQKLIIQLQDVRARQSF